MGNYAVIENNNVVNIIVAESQKIAEDVTGFACIEFEDETAEVGGTYENGQFVKRKPFPSWIREENYWVAPIEYPGFDEEDPKVYQWNEETVSWEVIPV
jgi:hypothetical protein